MADGKHVEPLELALAGVLFVAAAVCVKLHDVAQGMRDGFGSKEAMAFIITDEGVKSDSAQAQHDLDGAQTGLEKTQDLLDVFTISLIVMGGSLGWRFARKVRENGALKPTSRNGHHARR